MQSSVCFGLVFLLHLLSYDFYQVFLNSCIGLALIWSIVKNWTQLLNWQGKNRLPIEPRLNSCWIWESDGEIWKVLPQLHGSSKTASQNSPHKIQDTSLSACLFILCLFIPWDSWQISDFSVTPFGKSSVCHCSVCFQSLTRLLSSNSASLKSDTGALDNWCDGLEVTLSRSLVSRRWNQVIADPTCVWALVLTF